MLKYIKVNIKLTDAQPEKLKTAVRDNTGTTLRMSLRMFDGNDLPHELLLTTQQKTKLRNAFNNNMSTDIKLSIGKIYKIVQSGGSLNKLGSPLIKAAVHLAKNIFPPLGITASALAIDAEV